MGAVGQHIDVGEGVERDRRPGECSARVRRDAVLNESRRLELAALDGSRATLEAERARRGALRIARASSVARTMVLTPYRSLSRAACAQKVPVRFFAQKRRAWHESPPRTCIPIARTSPPPRGRTDWRRRSTSRRVAGVIRSKKKWASSADSHAEPNVFHPVSPIFSGLRRRGSSSARPFSVTTAQQLLTLK